MTLTPRLRWAIEGMSFVVLEAVAAFAFFTRRTDPATALFISGFLVVLVELIYSTNLFVGRTVGGAAGSGWNRGNILVGAILGWALALLLAVLGVYHLIAS